MAHRSYSQDQVHILSSGCIDCQMLRRRRRQEFYAGRGSNCKSEYSTIRSQNELLIAKKKKDSNRKCFRRLPSGIWSIWWTRTFIHVPAVHEAVSLGSSVLSLQLVRDRGDWAECLRSQGSFREPERKYDLCIIRS